MHRSIYKRSKVTLTPTHSQNVYNLKNNECRWPVNLIGSRVENCGFHYDVIYDQNNIKVVKLNKNSFLYHKTFIEVGKESSGWWLTDWPPPRYIGGLFFNQSEIHQSLHPGTHQLKYETKCEVQLLYIQNLTTQFKKTVGNDFVLSIEFKNLIQSLEKDGIKIDGYMGCNECEIFIFNNTLKRCIYKKPREVKDVRSYID